MTTIIKRKFSERISKLEKPIPITLLSGFLGSGKTTLLEHILTTNHGFKIAVIVNDVSQLNVDATLIKDHKVTNKEEKLIQLQNGCICCTLRGDLLDELVNIAQENEFQYIIIESTGISEPMQVAETFTTEFSNMLLNTDDAISEKDRKTINQVIQMGGLNKLTKLDTCVTVVDAKNFMDSFETVDFLADRYGDGNQGELERTITDLLVDQIEFADVIIINKIGTVKKKNRNKIEAIIKLLNPVAKIIRTNYSKVDVHEVINTKLYDFEKASTSAGWLQSINEMTIRDGFGSNGKSLAPKPETEEYGINNFIYRARKPFHPERLYNLLKDKFIIIENHMQQEQENESENLLEENTEEQEDNSEDENNSEDEVNSEDEDNAEEDDEISEADLIRNKKNSPFGPMIRSKGFIWLASRFIIRGEWSSAGSMLTLKGGIPWFAVTGNDFIPPEAAKLIEKDMEGEFLDRRQEIVFIGLKIDESAIKKELDKCLLTDEEFTKFKTITKQKSLYKVEKALLNEYEDGFEDWIILEDEANEEEDKIVESKEIKIVSEKHNNHVHIQVSG